MNVITFQLCWRVLHLDKSSFTSPQAALVITVSSNTKFKTRLMSKCSNGIKKEKRKDQKIQRLSEPGKFLKSGSIPPPLMSIWFGVTYFPIVTTTPEPSRSSNTD